MHQHRLPSLPAMMGFGTEFITDEMRAGALADAESTTAKIDAIRKRLELPIEQLPIVVDAYIGALNTRVAKEQARVAEEEQARFRAEMAGQSGAFGGTAFGGMNLAGMPMCTCGGVRKPQG